MPLSHTMHEAFLHGARIGNPVDVHDRILSIGTRRRAWLLSTSEWLELHAVVWALCTALAVR